MHHLLGRRPFYINHLVVPSRFDIEVRSSMIELYLSVLGSGFGMDTLAPSREREGVGERDERGNKTRNEPDQDLRDLLSKNKDQQQRKQCELHTS